MSITAEAPRGGVVEYIGGTSYVFLLRNREIERFEDKHRGIFDFWDGVFGRGKKPTSTEVKDLLALGLVGGGMKDAEADKVLSSATPADLLRLYQIAQAVLGIAFMPDTAEEIEKASKKKPLEDQELTALTSEA
jgi:hypothetical protein